MLSVEDQFSQTGSTTFADFQQAFQYYPTGDIKNVTLNNLHVPTGPSRVSTLTYRDDGLLTGLNETIGSISNTTSNWSYLDNGWLNTQTSGNGVKATYTLDQRHQLLDLTNTSPTGAIISRYTGISYDATGNHTSHTESLPGANLQAFDGTTTYGYDTKDQLTSEVKTSAHDPFSFNYQ